MNGWRPRAAQAAARQTAAVRGARSPRAGCGAADREGATGVVSQYATGLSRSGIEQALRAAGTDLDALAPASLAPLADFHSLGRAATRQLAGLAGITAADRVLDAGAGIGGTAGFLAAEHGCRVSAVDLTGEYCGTARWLNELTGLADRVGVCQGSVTGLPFASASFDVVTSLHVQMNVAAKDSVYAASWCPAAAWRSGTWPGRRGTRCRGQTSRSAATSSHRGGCAPPCRTRACRPPLGRPHGRRGAGPAGARGQAAAAARTARLRPGLRRQAGEPRRGPRLRRAARHPGRRHRARRPARVRPRAEAR